MGNRRRKIRKYPKRYCPIEWFKCIGFTKEGKGIVLYKNKEFFIDELIVGEEARIMIYYETEDHGVGRAIEIKEWSDDRALPLGHWKFSLGSYHLPHLKDSAQDAFKQSRINNYWPSASPIIVGKRTNYRNKVSLTNGGFMLPGRFRRQSIKPEKFDLMEIDFSKYEETTGVWIIRDLKTRIEGKPGTKIFAEDEVLGKKFIVGLDSFYQVNSEMAEKAYQKIIDSVDQGDVIFDLFAGASTIGIHLSENAKQVYSIEINKDSHKDALKNVELNNIKNVECILGDANEFVLTNNIKPDTIVIDPARAGISLASAMAINNSGANKIIYLSCNIDTQFRDIKLLDNYKIEEVQPYDFFPQTFHIENLVVLIKK